MQQQQQQPHAQAWAAAASQVARLNGAGPWKHNTELVGALVGDPAGARGVALAVLPRPRTLAPRLSRVRMKAAGALEHGGGRGTMVAAGPVGEHTRSPAAAGRPMAAAAGSPEAAAWVACVGRGPREPRRGAQELGASGPDGT